MASLISLFLGYFVLHPVPSLVLKFDGDQPLRTPSSGDSKTSPETAFNLSDIELIFA